MSTFRILNEDGSFILAEDGSYLIQETLAVDFAAQSSLSSTLTVTPLLKTTLSSVSSVSADITTGINLAVHLGANDGTLLLEDGSGHVLTEDGNRIKVEFGESILTGLLGSVIDLSATLQSSSSLIPALSTSIDLAANLSSSSTFVGDVSTGSRLAATLESTSTLTPNLTTGINLEANLSSSSSVSAAITTVIALQSELKSQSTLVAEIYTGINALATTFKSQSSLDASLTVLHVEPQYTPLNQNIFLAEIEAFDPATNSVRILTFSTGQGYTAQDNFYVPRISQPASIQRTMGGGTTAGGRVSISLGELTLVNTDGGLNSLSGLYMDGRKITLKRGDSEGIYGNFTTILVSNIESIAIESKLISIRLRDRAVTLDQPFTTVKYAGTNVNGNGIEGTADDIKGQSKPRIFGRIALMQPILVNTGKLIYQVNGASIDNVVNVFDAGAYLTRSTDYSSQSDMEGNDPISGTWRAWPAGGCFRLGSPPFGQISVCVTEKWDYLQCSAAGIIQRILIEKGFTSADWVSDDFAALNQRNVGSIGLIVEDGETTASLLDRICESVGAWWGFDAFNRFRVARFEAPSGSPVATFNDDVIEVIERQPEAQLPIWQTTLKSDRNYAVQDKKSLAGIVSPARTNWFANESRDQKVESTTTKSQRLLAEAKTYDSLLNGISQSQAESARRLALFSVRRDLINLTVMSPANYTSIDIGSVISVQTNRLGYQDGKLFTVTGVLPDYQANKLDIIAWG